MATRILKVEERKEFGKGPNHRLRTKGLVPINIINGGKSTLGSVGEKEMDHLIQSGLRKASTIELDFGSKKETAFIKEIQRFPHTGKLRHIDFYKLVPGKKVTAIVGLVTTGSPKGAKLGGQYNHILHEMKVKCDPAELVDVITVDVTELGIGDMIKVSNLKVPTSWEIQVNGDPIIASVMKTRALLAQEREEKKDAAPAAKTAGAKAAAKAPAGKSAPAKAPAKK